MFFEMKDGKVKGLFVMGENLAVGGPGARVEREALRKLDWWSCATRSWSRRRDFWKLDGVDPATWTTEVFFMPAAGRREGRQLHQHAAPAQWHEKAVDPPGDAARRRGSCIHLGRRLKELYAGSQQERDQPLLELTWDYPTRGRAAGAGCAGGR